MNSELISDMFFLKNSGNTIVFDRNTLSVFDIDETRKISLPDKKVIIKTLKDL